MPLTVTAVPDADNIAVCAPMEVRKVWSNQKDTQEKAIVSSWCEWSMSDYDILSLEMSVLMQLAGHTMEGTRLTIVKVPNQPDAYEFSIRTPVTPPRWKDFEQVSLDCISRLAHSKLFAWC